MMNTQNSLASQASRFNSRNCLANELGGIDLNQFESAQSFVSRQQSYSRQYSITSNGGLLAVPVLNFANKTSNLSKGHTNTFQSQQSVTTILRHMDSSSSSGSVWVKMPSNNDTESHQSV